MGRFSALSILFVLAGACAVEGGRADSRRIDEPIVLERRGAEIEPAPAGVATEEEVAVIAAATEAALLRGDYESALRLSDDLVARGLASSARGRLEPLRAEARRKLLQTLFLDGMIRTDRDRFALGEPITGEVLLINLAGETITVFDAPPGGSRATAGGRSTLHFDVRYTERDANGTVVRDRLTWTVVVGRDVVLPPGGRESFPLNLDTLGQNPTGVTLRTYEIEAALYPSEIRAGGESVTGVVRFRPRTVRVFPRNYEHLAADPVGRIAEAIRKRSPVHLPLAAALVAPADRAVALLTLRGALDADGPDAPDQATRTACCVAAQILTGDDLPADPALWRTRLAEAAAGR